MNFYTVGIGASAGGLEAIESLFSNITEELGLAYVIIQHLSPDYKSLMPEILSKYTKLPIITAKSGLTIKPNHIYLIPRKMNMKVFNGKLMLKEKEHHTLNLPIDIFLNSLAQDAKDKAIGIILSGTGSDGSRGIRTIKELGGMVIVQNPDNAQFDGMPRSAISTGLADYVVNTDEIYSSLVAYVKYPFIAKDKKNKIYIENNEDFLSKVLFYVNEHTGLDFSNYRKTTIIRRLERRLTVNQIDEPENYIRLLYSSKQELKTLSRELLIGVTRFFRDNNVFKYIEELIIPKIFKQRKDNDVIRIWTVGCSTGEEAYSIAILIKEYLEKNQINKKVKIFATDVDKQAIEIASSGEYSASIVADVDMKRLEKYFIKNDDKFIVKKSIRELVVFAQHNIINDPPFHKIDFLICRNLLIYFQPKLQQQVLNYFLFSLNQNGFLCLGSSESIGKLENQFKAFNIKLKIFVKKDTYDKQLDKIHNFKLTQSKLTNLKIENKKANKIYNNNDLINNTVTKQLLTMYAPTTVTVDSNCNIIATFGNINHYLKFPEINNRVENISFNLLNMVPESLKITFNIGIKKAFKTDKKITYNGLKYKDKNDEKELKVSFFRGFTPTENTYVNVSFEELKKDDNKQKVEGTINDIAKQQIEDLESELKFTKENLQASIEELETTNEELQATNEELISSNEELQATNEELQSVNEELYTVNTEFQIKNSDLSELNNDMKNLMQSSEMRIIFLDNDLNIKRFTDDIKDIFNLKTSDEGRPLADITHEINKLDLIQDAKDVLTHQQKIVKTINSNKNWYQMKMIPYYNSDEKIQGLIITFFDITELYNLKTELEISHNDLQTIIQKNLDAIYYLTCKKDENNNIVDFIIKDINKQVEHELSMPREKLINKGICELFPINIEAGFFDKYKNVFLTGKTFEDEYIIPHGYTAPGAYKHQVVPINNGIIIFNKNISKTKQAEHALIISEHLIDSLKNAKQYKNTYNAYFNNKKNAFARHKIVINDNGEPVDYVFLEINSIFTRLTGLSSENILNKRVKKILPDIEDEWIKIYGKVALTGEPTEFIRKSEALNKTFKISAYSLKRGEFITIFEEITND